MLKAQFYSRGGRCAIELTSDLYPKVPDRYKGIAHPNVRLPGAQACECRQRCAVSMESTPESNARIPYLRENLWGYGKRLRFVDGAIQREFPGKKRGDLRILDVGCGNG